MSRSHVLYWIWLSLCFSPGSKASDILLQAFDENAQNIFDAPDEAYDSLDLSEEVKEKLRNKDSAEARRIYFWCRDHGVRLLAYDDPDFPERLKTIGHRPVLLYAQGRHIDMNGNLLLAMVGTRRMSSYGKRTAYEISHDLCRAGAVVVSGMALGVDAVCHRAALDAEGETIAVLGCGVDIAYPKQNLDLMLELEKKGLILSEFKPGTRPNRSNFPIRNRIISGISQGTFVVEGDRSSGAMITARCALSQGRDLFALPGMVGEQNSEGTNALLREGATPVTCAYDLLSDYQLLYPDKIYVERIPIYKNEIDLRAGLTARAEKISGMKAPAPKEHKPLPEKANVPCDPPPAFPKLKRLPPDGTDENCRRIFDALCEADEPLSADGISVKTGLSVSDVLSSATVMEIMELVVSLPGGRYILK